ncbi:HD domain-containing protein [Calidifontibacter sp. DB0510]|uniref:HD domain-containing protein n=1 Tax=Metallococcus carri TaxID=1656884 RepID=A0A967B1S8_9MICO|nr:HD domain-containing phosphohydrolase [Metallococcus carri]NHN56424.1 HD domain-containing protein [Metallococcus carri]NOP36048.1 HD domain-containing protein [Calidifontibacter sp. DB2511S]
MLLLRVGVDVDYPLAVVVLAVIAVAAESGKAGVTRLAAMSLSSVMIGVAVVLCGPIGAAIVGIAGPGLVLSRTPLDGRAYNAAMSGWTGLLGGVAYLVVGGVEGGTVDSLFFELVWPLTVATTAMLITNAVLLVLIVTTTSDTNAMRAWRDFSQASAVPYYGGGLITFLIVVLWVGAGLGPATIPVMLGPLVLAQAAYSGLRADESTREETVTTLIAAVEARNPHWAGRSGVVARICEVLGAHLRLSDAQMIQLNAAARLHNIGLVRPLHQHQAIQPQRRINLLAHPQRGVEMLSQLEFLHDALPAVQAHHERWDGSGYPFGLAGERIPLLARVLAVGDLFAAELARATAADDPARFRTALAATRFAAGTRLDPQLVDALAAVVDNGRLIDALKEVELLRPDPFDHDRPDVADAIIGRTPQAAT